jgi:hypothetical protein
MSPAASALSREHERPLTQVGQDSHAEVWWAEVADLRERIESRRAAERVSRRREIAHAQGHVPVAGAGIARRTITITGHAASVPAPAPLRDPGSRDELNHGRAPRARERRWSGAASGASHAPGRPARASSSAQASTASRRRGSRTPAEWLGARPDRIAAWAVALGFLLVLAALISAH